MKILVDGRVMMHRTISGVERYTRLLIKHLARLRDIDVEVLTPAFTNRINQHIWEHFCLPFKALEYDLLFCPANIAPVWIPEGVKLVVTLHSVAYLERPDSYSRAFREYYRRVVPHIIEIAHHIVTVSNSERETILRHYPRIRDKISVIYSGIDPTFLSQDSTRKKYIMSVSSHINAKNMNAVIDAFNLVKERLDYNLRLVVSDPHRKKNFVYRFSNRIEIHYNLDDELLAEMYREAALFVMPSRYESFCFPVMEAIAAGTPVVSTPLLAIKEIAGEAVFFSEGFDAESISRAIFIVLTNPNISENLKKNREEVIRRFRWEISAREYADLFKKVIRKNEG